MCSEWYIDTFWVDHLHFSRKSGLFVYNPEVFIQTLPSLELSGLQDTWKVKTLACTYTVLYIVLKGVPDFGDIVQWGAPLDLDPNLLLFSSLLQSTRWETYSKQKAKNIERIGEIRNYPKTAIFDEKSPKNRKKLSVIDKTQSIFNTIRHTWKSKVSFFM